MMNLKFMKTTFLRALVCALLACELTVFSGETAGGVTSQTGRTGQTSRTDPCKPQPSDSNSIKNEIQISKFKTQNLPGSSSSISSTEENTAAGTSALHVMDESHGSGRGGLPHDRSFQYSAYNVQTANSVTDATPCVSTHSTPSASRCTQHAVRSTLYAVRCTPSRSGFAVNGQRLTVNGGFSLCDNPFRYSGYYTDTESGMNYLKARCYSPKYNVFTNRDTYNLDNRFAYCAGNPVMYDDQDGHAPVLWGRAGIFVCLGLLGVSAMAHIVVAMSGNSKSAQIALGMTDVALICGAGLCGYQFFRNERAIEISRARASRTVELISQETQTDQVCTDMVVASSGAEAGSNPAPLPDGEEKIPESGVTATTAEIVALREANAMLRGEVSGLMEMAGALHKPAGYPPTGGQRLIPHPPADPPPSARSGLKLDPVGPGGSPSMLYLRRTEASRNLLALPSGAPPQSALPRLPPAPVAPPPPPVPESGTVIER